MLEVKFHQQAEDSSLRFAVIAARYQGHWVFCKHKDRQTLECPGGHREPLEPIEETARRELWEETGAVDFTLHQICPYSVQTDTQETYGMLFFAEIHAFGELPALEIDKIVLSESLPEAWTYPLIQPKLLQRALQSVSIKN